MTLLLNCQDLCKSIGSRSLISSLSFTVHRGDRLGIIGANGSGKTTLLRLLAGLDSPDSGILSFAGKLVIGYLPQQDVFDNSKTAVAVLLDALRTSHLDANEQLSRAQTLLSRADFTNFDIPAENLSGGWRKRLAICRALLHSPDILLMDEPTNHLDLEGIIWLENLLSGSSPDSPPTFIFVSHDRVFLDNLATRIIEIAPFYPQGSLQVNGSYSDFVQRRAEFLSQQQEHETRLANRVRRETDWLQRGPKARTTKAKFRVDEAGRLQEELAQLRRRNRNQARIDLDFTGTARKTKRLLVGKDLAKSFGGQALFKGLDIVLEPGRRIGLLGKNGCGKSTLMKMLAADDNSEALLPDQGSIRIADGVQTVYFAQDRHQLTAGLTLRQALSPEGDAVYYRGRSLHIVTWAGKFLFRPEQLDTPVENLSGGEQARIRIANLMRRPADILLLDEPTNDLDIPSLRVLEESILDFPGAVVLVTHDRFLLNRVCDYVLGFDGRGRVEYFADYSQWYRSLPGQEKRGPAKSAKAKPKAKTAGRLSYLEQREYDGMEEAIMAEEEREEELRQKMENGNNTANAALLEETWLELEEIQARLAKLYTRWDELDDKLKSG